MGTGIRKPLHHVWSGILIVTVDRPVGMRRGKLLVKLLVRLVLEGVRYSGVHYRKGRLSVMRQRRGKGSAGDGQ